MQGSGRPPVFSHDKYINWRTNSKAFAKINQPWAKPRHKVIIFDILLPEVEGYRKTATSFD